MCNTISVLNVYQTESGILFNNIIKCCQNKIIIFTQKRFYYEFFTILSNYGDVK